MPPGRQKKDNRIADAKEIIRLRIANGLTQEELAARAGLSEKTIQRAEMHGVIGVKTLRLIANALNVPPFQIQFLHTPAEPKHGYVSTGRDYRTNKSKTVLAQMTRIHFKAAIDIPSELKQFLLEDQLASKFFLALYLQNLLREGALQIEGVWGTFKVKAMLTKSDCARIYSAWKRGKLAHYRIIDIRPKPSRIRIPS